MTPKAEIYEKGQFHGQGPSSPYTGPSQTNQSNLLVDYSKPPVSSAAAEAEEAVEEAVEEAAEEAAEEAEGATTLMTTPTPSLHKPQMGSSMGRNQRYSRETEK